MEDKVYWFITVFETAEIDTLGWPKTGPTRCWGFYTNKEDALNTLHNNMIDLWETCYDYAILEPYHEGICGYGFKEDRQFFKYDREKMDILKLMNQKGLIMQQALVLDDGLLRNMGALGKW